MDNLMTESPLWLDIREILQTADSALSFTYKATLHTDQGDVPLLKVKELDIYRDYENSIGDHINLVADIPLGVYMFRIFPHRANMEISVHRERNLNWRESAENSETVIERYKVVFNPDNNPPGIRIGVMHLQQHTLDISEIVTINLQLLDRALEPLRMKTVPSMVFRDAEMEEILHTVVSEEFSKIDLDGDRAIERLDIVQPDNEEEREALVIPDGGLLMNFPTYLQEQAGGLYFDGVGTYLQRYKDHRTLFIYPNMNFDRFDEVEDKLLVFYAPDGRLNGEERTSRVNGGVVEIVSTESQIQTDDAENSLVSQGAGFRAANQNAFMGKPVEITEDGVVADRTKLVHEISLVETSDKLNFSPMLPAKSTANLYRDISRVKSRMSGREQFIWVNADYDLIYPGMPARILRAVGEDIMESEGLVVSVEAFVALNGPITSKTYTNKTVVTVAYPSGLSSNELPEIPDPDVNFLDLSPGSNPLADVIQAVVEDEEDLPEIPFPDYNW